MGDQGSFDFTPPRTRPTDPATSHRAEHEMRKSGRLSAQRDVTYRLVELFQGRTSKELAAESMHFTWAACLGEDVGARNHAIGRRLPEIPGLRAEDTPFARARRWWLATYHTKPCCGAPDNEECYGRCSSRNQDEE